MPSILKCSFMINLLSLLTFNMGLKSPLGFGTKNNLLQNSLGWHSHSAIISFALKSFTISIKALTIGQPIKESQLSHLDLGLLLENLKVYPSFKIFVCHLFSLNLH